MINKGEELYLCLRHTKEKNYEFNDRNLVIFSDPSFPITKISCSLYPPAPGFPSAGRPDYPLFFVLDNDYFVNEASSSVFNFI